MTHYIGVVASLAIRRSPASTQPANLLLIPARAPRIGARGRVHCLTSALPGFAKRPFDLSVDAARFQCGSASMAAATGRSWRDSTSRLSQMGSDAREGRTRNTRDHSSMRELLSISWHSRG